MRKYQHMRLFFISVLLSLGLWILFTSKPQLTSYAQPLQDDREEDGLSVSATARDLTTGKETTIIVPGQKIAFEIIVSNTSTVTLTNVIVEAPDNATLEDFDFQEPKPNGNNITWVFDTLGPGETKIITYQAAVTTPLEPDSSKKLTYTVNASAKKDSCEATPSSSSNDKNSSCKASANFQIQPPELLKLLEDNYLDQQGTIKVTLELTNTRATKLQDLIIIDEFTHPKGDIVIIRDVEILEFSSEREYEVKRNTIEWDVGDLPPNVKWEVTYEVTFTSDTISHLENTALVNDVRVNANNKLIGQLEQQLLFNTRPNFEIEQHYTNQDGSEEIHPGDTVIYTINYKNLGTIAAKNAIIEVEFDPNVLERVAKIDNGAIALGSITKGGDYKDGKLVWEMPEIARAGEVQFKLILKNDIPTGFEEVGHTVYIDADNSDPIDVNGSSIILLTPLATPTPPPVPQTTDEAPFEDAQFGSIANLVGILMLGSLVVLGYRARELRTSDNGVGTMRELVEMFTIFIVVTAVLVLAMVTSIGPTAAVSVLSGIAGYVLGRGAISGSSTDGSA
jgi:hypothetical protein